MYKILEYVAIASALIGVVYLSLFCNAMVGWKKDKMLKYLIRALIFIGIFAIYVFAAIKLQLPFF